MRASDGMDDIPMKQEVSPSVDPDSKTADSTVSITKYCGNVIIMYLAPYMGGQLHLAYKCRAVHSYAVNRLCNSIFDAHLYSVTS